MSAPRAIWMPPPRAWPWTAAITGTGSSCHAHATCWPRWVTPLGIRLLGASSAGASFGAAVRSPLAIALNAEKSSPAQNDSPSPDSTTTRTSGIDFSCSPASRSPANIAPSSALRFSGRFMRTSAMPWSSTLMVTRSLINRVLPGIVPTMKLNLTADEVLTTTRSVRKRLDFDKPVDRAVVEECLEIALQAPTGSNRQGWHWVVVEDPELKAAVADVYRTNFDMYRSMPP